MVFTGAKAASMQTTLQHLTVALADMKAWHEKGQQGKQLLNNLLRTRHAAAETRARLRYICIGGFPGLIVCKVMAT